MLKQLGIARIHLNTAMITHSNDWSEIDTKAADVSVLAISSSQGGENVQINARGWGILKQFERLPSCTEQSVREAERAVLRQVTVPLTSNQFSALVSLTYSLGEANLKRSMLLRHLNAGRYQAAANEFDRWVYVGLKRLPELVVRRMAEKQLFLRDKP